MKTWHPEELALLAAIHAEPSDDTPRLVYATWLQKHGRRGQAEYLLLEYSDFNDEGLFTCQERLHYLRHKLSTTEPRWYVQTHRDLVIPPNLSERGTQAVRLILDLMVEEKLVNVAECPAFHSPGEWQTVDEWRGASEPLLIVSYWGGDLALLLTRDAGEHPAFDKLTQSLNGCGMSLQQVARWYSVISEADVP